MKLAVRKIGNSKGVILPQSYLKECSIDDEVNVEIKDKHIIISAPVKEKRKGWEEAFKEMAANGDDKLALPDVFNDEDNGEWTW